MHRGFPRSLWTDPAFLHPGRISASSFGSVSREPGHLVHHFAAWQRVRDSNPCTGLERALIYFSKCLMERNLCIPVFSVAAFVATALPLPSSPFPCSTLRLQLGLNIG